MPAKVVLKFTKGSHAGSELVYTEKEVLFVGRDQNDCQIVLPEPTVSRLHCFLEVVPPAIRVHDFGSLNGTYLNGELIGKRPGTMSIEDARNLPYNEYNMQSGDRLSLGNECEFTVDIQTPELCSECKCEIDQPQYVNAGNKPVCAACYNKEQERIKAEQAALKKLEQERLKAEKAALDKKKAEEERKEAERVAAALKKEKEELMKKTPPKPQPEKRSCEICGSSLEPNGPDICENCRKNPLKILEFLLKQAEKGNENAREIAGYRNIRTLGKGGMGEVWLVREEATGKEMALKLMLPQVAVEEHAKNMFLREAHLSGQLRHKNVVEQLKCGRSGDIYFILMEYCKDGSVDNLIKKNHGKLSLDQATRITLQVLDGLHYVHTKTVKGITTEGKEIPGNGIVHRDFKPANIFLHAGTAKVADFGLAKAFDTAGLSGFTYTGALAGTVVFMPRQQIANYKYVKPEVDVWATAACYYFMLTGRYVRDYDDKSDWVIQALRNPPVSIRMRDPEIPRRLADVIDAALIERPGIGIKTAAELKQAISAAL
ncbi:MAG: protein kinase [Tannerellaceae bacterium]|jgi:serine/threonine-protein kinase|nr:protein kinase [Tannerellaceae bacterium]